jgi:hypothetical protein
VHVLNGVRQQKQQQQQQQQQPYVAALRTSNISKAGKC